MLGLNRNDLDELYIHSNSFFFLAGKKRKSDGSYRYTYDVAENLKIIHEKICSKFLRIVNYPPYLLGSLRGRDYLDNASIHTSKKVLIKEDITNFFPSISKKIVYQIWISFFKFSHEVSEYLSELITYNGYLVQGAIPSSYICNLALWNREAELVSYFTSKGYTYTRYVDDIIVSSKKIISLKEKTDIIHRIYSLLGSIGAKPNRKKHKIMPRDSEQLIHNVNTNRDTPTLPKKTRAQIKSAVYQCEREYIKKPNSKLYLNLYNSTFGRVNMLKRLHFKEGSLLEQRLKKIKPID